MSFAPNRVYPWESVVGGESRLFVRGRDFACSARAFAAAARRYADTHRLRVRVARELDCIWLRFTGPC